MADVKGGGGNLPRTNRRNNLQRGISGKRDKVCSPCGSKHTFTEYQLSNATFRRMQENIEVENQQIQKEIQTLQDNENGFMKDLENFLGQQEVLRQRRRELLHKSWDEHVWYPMHKKVREYVSVHSPTEVKRRQSLLNDYLDYCNSKGYVSLDVFNTLEYNPFLLSAKVPRFNKVKTADLKERSSLHFHERLKEKKSSSPGEPGRQSTRRKAQKLPENIYCLSKAMLLAAHLPRASFQPPAYAPIKIQTADGMEQKHSDWSPYPTVSDGSCRETGCWFFRDGGSQQTSSLQQLN